MQKQTLRVRARGAALVQKLEAMASSPRQFIGREWVFVDGQHGLKATGEDVEIADRAEYRQAIREGSLWAADRETADACGVAFDPNFGEAPESKLASKSAR